MPKKTGTKKARAKVEKLEKYIPHEKSLKDLTLELDKESHEYFISVDKHFTKWKK